MERRYLALIVLGLLALGGAFAVASEQDITILFPADISPWSPVVLVRGASPKADSISWEVLGTKLAGSTGIGRDGSFEFSFPTGDLHLSQLLRIRAKGARGWTAERSLMLLDPYTGPELEVLQPSEGSLYASRVTISGNASVPAGVAASPKLAPSLSWRISGTPLSGTAAVGSDGLFSFDIPTRGLHGTRSVVLRAEDSYGHFRLRFLSLAEDTRGPDLAVLSPADGSVRSPRITVEGRVSDSADMLGSTEEIRALSWSAAGVLSFSGPLTISSDGSFRFSVPPSEIHGDLTITIRAEKWNDRAAAVTLTLREPPPTVSGGEGGAPSVTITSPASGEYFRQSIRVEGRVSQAADLASLTYEVEGVEGAAGDVRYGEDGSFSFEIPSAGFTGDRSLAIAAQGKDGKTARASVPLRDGNRAPELALDSPGENEVVGSKLLLSGRIVDPYAGEDIGWGIESLLYEIIPLDVSVSSTPLRGRIDLGKDDSFRLVVPARTLAGPQRVTLTATARNARRAEKVVRVQRGDSDIPSFSVSAADGELTFNWNPVPETARSSLLYTVNGQAWDPAAATEIPGVQPPYVMKGLSNGSRYAARLKAVGTDGEESWSAEKRIIPLSPDTLKPLAVGEFQRISVSWSPIPGADAFEVWRSPSVDAGFTRVSGTVRGTAYIDTSAESGKTYFYRVRPSRDSELLSAVTEAQTLDVSPTALERFGLLALPDVRAVAVDVGYAYVATGDGVTVVDIADPRNPVAIGTARLADARGISVRGRFAYVADGETGLAVIDARDPRKPAVLGSRYTSDPRGAAIVGDIAYVADGKSGLKVIDVSTPRTPARIASIEAADARAVVAVAVAGRPVLCLADGRDGLVVFDASSPKSPVRAAAVPLADPRGLAAAGSLVLVACADGVKIVDVSNPGRPVIAGSFDAAGVEAVAAGPAGDYALAAMPGNGIAVLDISKPAHPLLIYLLQWEGARSIAISAGFSYAAGSSGLAVMRSEVLGRSYAVAGCRTEGKAWTVSVNGDFAYVAGHAGGMRIIDLQYPASATDASQVGSFPSPFARKASVEGTLALVADGSTGLLIVDVSSREKPVQVGAWRPGGTVYAASAAGPLALAANGGNGVKVLDISDPANPRQVGSLASPDAQDVVAREGLAYIADGEVGIRVIDISDPANPSALGEPIPFAALRISAAGATLIAAGPDGVAVIDLGDPRAPVLTGRYETPWAMDAVPAGRYAYVAEGHHGMTVLDISRPGTPPAVSSCPDVFAVGVAARGEYAVVVDTDSLKVIRIVVPPWLAPR